jgi:tetratricopeptide (TPR) repeat protein
MNHDKKKSLELIADKFQNQVSNFKDQLATAILENDQALLEAAKCYSRNNLIPLHISASRESWNCSLYYANEVLIRYLPYEFNNLDLFQKHLEILRAYAEARLIHYRLGFCSLTEHEKEALTKRALGILPESVNEELREILSFPLLNKYQPLREILLEPRILKEVLGYISTEYGEELALIFFLFVHGGERPNDFEYYGQELTSFFEELFRYRNLRDLIGHQTVDNSFQNNYIILSVLGEVLRERFPERIKNETFISFVPFLKSVINREQKIIGSELLFAGLDSIILGRLGYRTNFVITEDSLQLEIILPERLLYWNPLAKKFLSYHKPVIKYRGNYLFLIALILQKTAQYYSKLGRDVNRGIEYYKTALDFASDYIVLYQELAEAYLKGKNPQLALEILKKAITVNPNDATCYYLQGIAYYLRKNHTEAITSFKQAIMLKPNYIEALNRLGTCYTEINNYEQAKGAYKQLISFAPQSFVGYYGLGNIYYALRDYNQALIYYQRAVALNPQDTKVLYSLAQTYYELGEFDASIKIYKELLKINPDHAPSWYNLGIIYRDKGMHKEAVKYLKRAVKLNPNLLR